MNSLQHKIDDHIFTSMTLSSTEQSGNIKDYNATVLSASTSLVVLRCPWYYNWKLRRIKWSPEHQLNVLREDDNRVHLGKAEVWSIGKPSMANIDDSGQSK